MKDLDPALFFGRFKNAIKNQFFLSFLLVTYLSVISLQKVTNYYEVTTNHRSIEIKVFSQLFCLLMERSASERPKNLRILIRNTVCDASKQ